VLLFHGPAKDGPPEACCGDYLHRFARFTPAQIRERQEKDAAELLSRGFGVELHLSAQVFFAEVEKDGDVRFVAWRAS
jgi:hypothetical protein